MNRALFELYIFTRYTKTDLNDQDAAKPVFYHCWRREANAAHPFQVLGLARKTDDIMNGLASSLDAGGIKAMSTDDYKMHSFTSASGYRFLLVTEPRVDTTKTQLLLKAIYEYAFVETVCKDPLYTPYESITSDAFKPRLEAVIAAHSHLLG